MKLPVPCPWGQAAPVATLVTHSLLVLNTYFTGGLVLVIDLLYAGWLPFSSTFFRPLLAYSISSHLPSTDGYPVAICKWC